MPLRQSRVFTERGLRTFTYILVYKAVVLPALMYGSETCVTYRRHIKALEQFQQRILRAILGSVGKTEQPTLTSLNRHAPPALRRAWLKLSHVGLGMSSACHTPEFQSNYFMSNVPLTNVLQGATETVQRSNESKHEEMQHRYDHLGN